MKRYIALLRGINIGGKNKIDMTELKEGFAEPGFTEVTTYLNSGNVIFSSAMDDKTALSNKVKRMIKDRFNLDIPVFIVLQEKLKDLLNNAPDWWGDDNKDIYDNIIFLMPPLSYEEFFDEPFKHDFTPISRCIDPWHFVRSREVRGGTGEKAMESMIERA